MNALVVSPILLPLLGAVLALAWRNSPASQARIALWTSAGVIVIGISLLAALGGHGLAITQLGGWPVPAGIALVSDGLSAALVTIAGLMIFTAVAYRRLSLRESDPGHCFHPLLLALLGGVCGAFLTADLFNLFVWFEVILISSFALLAMEGRSQQIRASVSYVLLNLIASALFLIGLGLVYGKAGTLAMADVGLIYQQASAAGNGGSLDLAFALLLVAFAIKAGAFPLYAWLPASYHTPSHAVSAVFAGLLTKVGVYALIRLTTQVAPGADWIREVLVVIGMLTMLMGVLGAACQSEVRRILSYHIISQIGYLIAGIAIGGPTAIAAVVFYLIHHIVVKTNLFLVGGIIDRHRGATLSRAAGLASWTLLTIAFLVPALSLAGIPPLSGFAAKLGIIHAAAGAERYGIVAVALITGLLTLYSMIKIYIAAFWTPPERVVRHRFGLIRTSPMLGLAALTVVMGLAAGPVANWSQSVGTLIHNVDAYRRLAQVETQIAEPTPPHDALVRSQP
ncbi:MAG: proton-conducting transporter membrane subunit [Planctomycetota bacterium]|jgi:multicomponent Na+:H+ antiporter subunit D|nr:proton-conducting transporter membrane subunit [Planctomycetota bacterium]